MTAKADNVLAHHGVLGQKWGVRHDKGHEGEQAKTKKIAALDKKYTKKAFNFNARLKVYNSAAGVMNDHEIARINNEPRFKNASLDKPGRLRDAYYKEYSDTFTKILNQKAKEQFGASASGKQIEFSYDVSTDMLPKWKISEPDD